ncbi:hypothetical protein CsSME_00002625 [Camellia sinensis var. sinensis]
MLVPIRKLPLSSPLLGHWPWLIVFPWTFLCHEVFTLDVEIQDICTPAAVMIHRMALRCGHFLNSSLNFYLNS